MTTHSTTTSLSKQILTMFPHIHQWDRPPRNGRIPLYPLSLINDGKYGTSLGFVNSEIRNLAFISGFGFYEHEISLQPAYFSVDSGLTSYDI
jgi:hypothetical protein